MSSKNKPANTLFKQQRLPAWQPIMSPPHVSLCFIAIAFIFIPIGIAVLMSNSKVLEVEFKYSSSNCSISQNDGILSFSDGNSITKMGCKTVVSFSLDKDYSGPVYMYYKLTKFYQNHRRFAKSRNNIQLSSGKPVAASKLKADCAPLVVPGDFFGSTGQPLTVGKTGMKYSDFVYNPAGLMAWSIFNDTFKLYKVENLKKELLCDTSQFDQNTNLPFNGTNMSCTKKGIAWNSDAQIKFKKPSMDNNQWTAKRSIYGEKDIVSDNIFLANGWYANESGHRVPANTDEDLMVWLRTASLSTFRKLFRIFKDGLKKGDYEMEIINLYDTTSFGGEKYFAFATTTWFGGRNDFLAYGYIVMGSIVFVTAIVFFIIHKSCGDRSQVAIENLMNET
eukprot:Tbor_TRINITY_DN2994_c0_g1::TRINITY_DN2994_c0_g1_i1::g.1062::m.1062